MSGLFVALIMVCIGVICLRRALSRGGFSTGKDRRSFLIFCGVFGLGSVVQGLATGGGILLLWARIMAGLLLLAGAPIEIRRAA